ncbi:outer membrane beta-barrel protein [Arcobacter porcinus]|uniref:Porin family protein n=1 Tax=Arcobacter porcinus TaxID=1935204 RepID=A0A5C2HAK9_9BACT|nr:outer membrane beta-barrel protein [Arcobacter porcinus]OCL97171.1 hypothetical protein AAX27_00078 [Aliarcobacter thereius]QEP39829.1 porin family protein [Arcobacter porcinus]
MKKLITGGALASALLVSSASADSKWYAGIEVGSASNTTELDKNGSKTDTDNNYKDFKFVIGKGTGNDWYTQLYLSSITYDKKPWFSDDDKATEIGLEVMKQFKVHEKVYPFIKFGVGFTSMDTDPNQNFSESSILAVSATIGAGVDFKATENISILAGLDYNRKSWQDVEVRYNSGTWLSKTETWKTSDSATRFYFGANYRF